ncbi:MAG: elongation factor G [Thermoflexales bacterium]|nr:elongation factor G [Thermoflexales bacterium]
MKEYATEKLRNVALLGHSSSGKTTFAEGLLFASGAISRMGKVEDGTTVSDFDDEEKRRHQSVNLSVMALEWKDYKLNLIDCPGYTDFQAETRSAVRAADLGLIFVDAVSGVEVGTEIAMQAVDDAKIPRAVLISRMDRENADYDKVLAQLREAFHQDIVPLIIPVGAHADFSGVVDLISRKYLKGPKGEEAPIPADMVEAVDAAREKLIEAAAEGEDALMEKFFAGEELTQEELLRGLRGAIRNRLFVPVFCASPGLGIGMHAMLFSLVNYGPMPFDMGADPDDGQHGVGMYVFKTAADQFVGKVSFFRVIEGPVRGGDLRVVVTRTGNEERISTLLVPRGKEQITVPILHVGDIGCATKLTSAITGDTLCDKNHCVSLPAIEFPNPLFGASLHPKSKNDTAKISPAIARMVEEDPSLRMNHDQQTHEMVLLGMGQTHIDVAVSKLKNKFGVEVETAVPKVPYRETITRKGQSRHRHKKQTGGAGQFAEIEMSVEPTHAGDDFEFEWKVVGGTISGSYQSSIEKGVRQVLESGVIAGYKVGGVNVKVLDGKEHAVDSKPIAFEIASRAVFKEAFEQGSPALLEPVYEFVITVPEQYAGDVMSALKTKRAQVMGMDQKGNKTVITANAPLAEMQRFGNDLRSLTQGRGIFDLKFDHYARVPPALAEPIIAKHKAELAQQKEE